MWSAEDHTADARLVVEAEGWRALLAEATRAFGAWTRGAEADAREPAEAELVELVERDVRVDGADAAETWVRFWRALHRLWTVEGVLAVAAEIAPDASETAALARLRCLPLAALDPEHLVDVKAVTWHGAVVERLGRGRLRASIVLDV